MPMFGSDRFKRDTPVASILLMIFAVSSVQSCSGENPRLPVKPSAKPVAALHLVQTHFYFNDTEMYLAPEGIRINNRGRMYFSLVAAAPDWGVTIYRDDDRVFVHESLREFTSTGLVSNFVAKKHPRTIESRMKAKTDIHLGKFAARRFTNGRELYEYLPLGKYAPAQAEEIIYAAYKLPTNGGVPLKYIRKMKSTDWLSGVTMNGDSRTYLDIKTLEKTVVSPQLFVPPKNYRQAKSVQEVVLSKDNREASGDLDEFFDDGKYSKKP